MRTTPLHDAGAKFVEILTGSPSILKHGVCWGGGGGGWEGGWLWVRGTVSGLPQLLVPRLVHVPSYRGGEVGPGKMLLDPHSSLKNAPFTKSIRNACAAFNKTRGF